CWPPPTAPTRGAGGCCAKCRARVTPTSRRPGRSPRPAMTSPPTRAPRSAAAAPWCTATRRGGPRAPAPRPVTRRGRGPTGGPARAEARRQVAQRPPAALAAFDLRSATAGIWEVVEEANRYVERAEPWRLARAERDGDAAAAARLDESLALLIDTCAQLGREL